MNIALVTMDYPPERGGVARYLGNLVQAASGSIEVLVDIVHPSTGPGKISKKPFFVSGPIAWFPLIRHIRQLKKQGYDLVLVSHALPVGTAAWIAYYLGGLPYAVLLHGLDLRLAVRSGRKKWLLRAILQSARLVLTNSEFVAKEVRELVPAVTPRVLMPGVEPMTFLAREEARRVCGIKEEECVVLTVTRLVPRKGIDVLLEALGKLPQAMRLVVIGNGDDADRLGRLVQQHQLDERVTFIHHASDEERNQWYAAADLFAMPARDEGNDVEGFGIVYLEAALAGLPIIAGKSGGVVEAVQDGVTGILVNPTDVNEIASKLQDLYDHPAERERLGRAGKERMQRDFQWQDRWQSLQTWLN